MLALLETDENVLSFAEFAADQPEEEKQFCNTVPWNGPLLAHQGRRTAGHALSCSVLFSLLWC